MRVNEALSPVTADAQGNIQNRQSNGTTFPSPEAQLSLLGDSSYLKPRYPFPRNLTSKALELLGDGGSLSADRFHAETSSQRLAAYIFTLRRLGWDIRSKLDSRRRAHYQLTSHSMEFLQGGSSPRSIGWWQ